MFDKYLARWGLVPDGDPIVTPRSRLLPVRCKNVPAMLKIAADPEEEFGVALVAWWNGHGAAKILVRQGPAILLERATNKISLAELARTGRDDEATTIICAVVAELQAAR